MDMMEEETFSRADVRLDMYNLDAEVQKQSSLCQYWNEKEAKAKKDKDYCEIQLKVVLADVELALRKDTSLGKQTEASLKALVEINPEVKKARYALADAWHEVGMHSAVVKALDHKKKQLENAISLWMRDYYIDPGKSPNNRISSDLRSYMNRSRRNHPEIENDDPETED